MWSGLWRRWGTIPVLPANDNGQAAWVCAAKGCRGRPQSPRLAPAGAIPPAAMKIKPHGCALRRGVGGDRRLRLFSLPPPRLRRGESPCNNKDQETWVCTAKGCRGRPQSPRLAPAGAIPPAAMKIKPHGCALRRGVGGDRRLRLFSLPPPRLRRGESPCNNKDQETWVCTAKGCRGRPQSPRLAPAGAKSPAYGKDQL